MKITPSMPEMDALQRRRALLKGDETIRGIVFQSIERALVDVMGPASLEEVKITAGLADQKFDAMTKYPMAEFLKLEETAAARMADAVGGFDEAVCRLGGAAVDSFFDSIAGKTMALLAGKDPTRLLSAAPNGYSLLVSYGKRHWRQTSPNTGVFTFEGEYLGPVHNFGTFDTALRVVHGVDARFALESTGPLDFAFRVSW